MGPGHPCPAPGCRVVDAARSAAVPFPSGAAAPGWEHLRRMPREIDPAYATYVRYIDRTRAYYAAQGYERPYRYAHHSEVPFSPLPKPLSECRLGLITTAMPRDPATGKTPLPMQPYMAPVDPLPDAERLFTDYLTWDRWSTHMKDAGSYLPLARLQEYVSAGRVGSLSGRYYGTPMVYSQRETRENYAPAALAMLREDRVDAAFLVAI